MIHGLFKSILFSYHVFGDLSVTFLLMYTFNHVCHFFVLFFSVFTFLQSEQVLEFHLIYLFMAVTPYSLSGC